MMNKILILKMVDISKFIIGKKRAWVGEQQAENIEDSEYNTFKLGGVYDGDVSLSNVLFKQAKLIDSANTPIWIGQSEPQTNFTEQDYEQAYNPLGNFDFANNPKNITLSDLFYSTGWRMENAWIPKITKNESDISSLQTRQLTQKSSIDQLMTPDVLAVYIPNDFYWNFHSTPVEMYRDIPRAFRWTFSNLPIDFFQINLKHSASQNQTFHIKTSTLGSGYNAIIDAEINWQSSFINKNIDNNQIVKTLREDRSFWGHVENSNLDNYFSFDVKMFPAKPIGNFGR